MVWFDFIIMMLPIPAIMAVAGLLGGIGLLLFNKKRDKKIRTAGIISFAFAGLGILCIVGFLLIFIIGGSLFRVS